VGEGRGGKKGGNRGGGKGQGTKEVAGTREG